MTTPKPIVSLRMFLEAMETPEELGVMYINRKTGEIVEVPSDDAIEFAAQLADEEVDDDLAKLREAAESSDYLPLPNEFDVDEYDTMRRFGKRTDDPAVRDRLLDAIRGSGAFRRFKAAVYDAGLFPEWEAFRDAAKEAVAVEWLESNGFAFEREESPEAARPTAARKPPNIREGKPDDAAAWLTLRHGFRPRTSKKEHRKAIARYFAGDFPRWPWVVLFAEDDAGRLLGFVETSVRPYAFGCDGVRVAYLEGWFVAEDARGRGVGRALIAAAENWGRAQGCAEFASDADPNSRTAAGAHAAVGFKDVGIVRCFRKSL